MKRTASERRASNGCAASLMPQEIGVILIGMPGLEKKLARFPQFYSRIGFVHEFRPLGTKQVCELLDQRWTPPGVHLPQQPLDEETVAAIIRITGGNFRLLNRLLAQIDGSSKSTYFSK